MSLTNPDSAAMAQAQEQAASIQAGRYFVRFAQTSDELQQAQALRYRALYQEKNAPLSDEMRRTQREDDEWDPIAQHVIVLDTRAQGEPVVGTLRLVSTDALSTGQCLYTELAYDIEPLRSNYRKILELSRFCIDSEARGGAILMLIWKFTMQYIIAERFELMLGCASFPGIDIDQHRAILGYLYRNNLAPPELRSSAISEQAIDIASFLSEEDDNEDDWNSAKQAVPTLLRGYLKIGAKITDKAIIDPEFNTVFVGIYVDARDMVVQNHTLVPKN